MNRFLTTATVGACLAVLLFAGGPATAQPMHSLTIRDGQVWIDEQLVAEDDLPASLDLEGVQASYSFYGDVRPVIELGGRLYLLDDGRLREAAEGLEAPDGVSVFFRDRSASPGKDDSYVSLMREHALALQEHERDIERLSSETQQRQFERLRAQAQQAARVAQVLPRLEVRSYLTEVQQQNQLLYELLVREVQMEAEAQRLAQRIQRLPDGTERSRQIEALQQKLDAMFELKQENRRREIQRLEEELEALNAHLRKREAYRERIIRQRLLELVGESQD